MQIEPQIGMLAETSKVMGFMYEVEIIQRQGFFWRVKATDPKLFGLEFLAKSEELKNIREKIA